MPLNGIWFVVTSWTGYKYVLKKINSVAMISIELEKKEFDTYLLVGHDRNMFF